MKIQPLPAGEKVMNKYKYNGKEWQDELSLNVYDYGLRNYMPDIGRWGNIDNLAEKYQNLTPYVYVVNNPITNIDPDGNDIIFIVGNDTQQARNFVYRKGNFYDVVTKQRYDPSKSVSPTMYKVLTAYRKIEKSNDKRLKDVLHHLEKSKHHHYIVEGNSNVTHRYGVPENIDEKGGIQGGIGSIIEYNFSEGELAYSESDGVSFSIFDIVVHEMRHAFDDDIGNYQNDSDGKNENDPTEQRAVFFENLARQIEESVKRKRYGGEIPPEKLVNPPNNIFPGDDCKKCPPVIN